MDFFKTMAFIGYRLGMFELQHSVEVKKSLNEVLSYRLGMFELQRTKQKIITVKAEVVIAWACLSCNLRCIGQSREQSNTLSLGHV